MNDAELSTRFSQLEDRLAERLAAVVHPIADAVVSLQNNQAVLIAAVHRLDARLTAVEATQSTMLDAVLGLQVTTTALINRVDRLSRDIITGRTGDLSRANATEARLEERLTALELLVRSRP